MALVNAKQSGLRNVKVVTSGFEKNVNERLDVASPQASESRAEVIMKVFALLLGMMMFATANAATESPATADLPFKVTECRKQLDGVLRSWNTTGPWSVQMGPLEGGSAFRSPTNQLGYWVEIKRYQSGILEALRLSPSGMLSVRWDGKACEPRMKTSSYKVTANQPNEKNWRFFTDADLEKLVKSTEPGVVLLWGPGMIHSVQSVPRVTRIAKKLGVKLTILMDPAFPQDEARTIAKKHGIPFEDRRLESVELLSRNMQSHFPSHIVYGNGKLSRHFWKGAFDDPEYESQITKDLAELK